MSDKSSPTKRSTKPAQASIKGTKSKPGLPLPRFLQDILLPYLGGGIAAVVMVLFVVIQAVMVPAPMPPQQQVAAVAEQPTQQPAAAEIPAYRGPQEGTVAVTQDPLPLIDRWGDPVNELGRRVLMPQADFEAQTTLLTVDSYAGDISLGYRVRIPKDWTALQNETSSGAQVNNSLLGLMAMYVAPADIVARSSLRIKNQKLSYLTNARDFLTVYAANNRYTLQALSTFGPERAEAIYVYTQQDISYAVRLVVIISGPRALIAEYDVPMDKFETEKDLQTLVITSLQLLREDTAVGEKVRRVEFPQTADISVPESWSPDEPDVGDIDQRRLSFNRFDNTSASGTSILQGRVDVFAFKRVPENTEEKMISFINQSYAVQGIRLGPPKARFNLLVDNKNGLMPERHVIYPMNNDANTFLDYQYWVARVSSPGYIYMVGVLMPPKATSIANWLRNHGILDYVVANINEQEREEGR